MLFKRRPSVPLRSPSALWLLTDGVRNNWVAVVTKSANRGCLNAASGRRGIDSRISQ